MNSSTAVVRSDVEDDDFSFTTSSGCTLVFDESSQILCILGAEGSGVALSLADLEEIADRVSHGRFLRPLFADGRGSTPASRLSQTLSRTAACSREITRDDADRRVCAEDASRSPSPARIADRPEAAPTVDGAKLAACRDEEDRDARLKR